MPRYATETMTKLDAMVFTALDAILLSGNRVTDDSARQMAAEYVRRIGKSHLHHAGEYGALAIAIANLEESRAGGGIAILEHQDALHSGILERAETVGDVLFCAVEDWLTDYILEKQGEILEKLGRTHK